MRRIEPDPDQMPEQYREPLAVASGKGGFRIEAMLVRKCSGSPVPETLTEELLARNLEWLRVHLAHCLGVWPIEIPAGSPLPAWDAGWLRTVGETDELLSDEEAEVLRKRTDPALVWEIDVGETRWGSALRGSLSRNHHPRPADRRGAPGGWHEDRNARDRHRHRD